MKFPPTNNQLPDFPKTRIMLEEKDMLLAQCKENPSERLTLCTSKIKALLMGAKEIRRCTDLQQKMFSNHEDAYDQTWMKAPCCCRFMANLSILSAKPTIQSMRKELSGDQAYWLFANEIVGQASKSATPDNLFVANSKPQWKPYYGRHFSLFEKYPLTRIMESTDMPIDLPPSASSSPKITMVSRFTDHKLSDRKAGSKGISDLFYVSGLWLSLLGLEVAFRQHSCTSELRYGGSTQGSGATYLYSISLNDRCQPHSVVAYKSLFNEGQVMASSVESSEFRDIERIGSEKSSQRITHAEI
ncbi:hypothetical protein Tco_1067127 [Tanacetum coccineum]|uniref:Uncharacterized protein n=1 Tax=Tanacetum coccineum TaxID=301880 RepID=A0ABQ5HDS1_9ASTR